MSFTSRAIAAIAAAAVMTMLGASAASAHVTVHLQTAVAGSEAELTFRAPNEQASARFTKLVIHLPAGQPLASLATQPIPGWSVSLSKAKLAKPITTDDGTATEYTSKITWTATGGGVAPDQYQNFDVNVGPLPERGTITFTADQAYSDGTVVHWNEIAKTGAAEPENPAPVLTLTAEPDPGKEPSSDGVARGLGIAGLIVGAVGLVTGGLALRRRSPQA